MSLSRDCLSDLNPGYTWEEVKNETVKVNQREFIKDFHANVRSVSLTYMDAKNIRLWGRCDQSCFNKGNWL